MSFLTPPAVCILLTCRICIIRHANCTVPSTSAQTAAAASTSSVAAQTEQTAERHAELAAERRVENEVDGAVDDDEQVEHVAGELQQILLLQQQPNTTQRLLGVFVSVLSFFVAYNSVAEWLACRTQAQ